MGDDIASVLHSERQSLSGFVHYAVPILEAEKKKIITIFENLAIFLEQYNTDWIKSKDSFEINCDLVYVNWSINFLGENFSSSPVFSITNS